MRSKFSLALVCVRVCPCVCVSGSVCWNLATITWQEKGVIILLMVLLMTFYRQMQAFPPGSVTRRRFYTPRNLLPEALQGESFWPHTSLYTQTLLHSFYFSFAIQCAFRTGQTKSQFYLSFGRSTRNSCGKRSPSTGRMTIEAWLRGSWEKGGFRTQCPAAYA